MGAVEGRHAVQNVEESEEGDDDEEMKDAAALEEALHACAGVTEEATATAQAVQDTLDRINADYDREIGSGPSPTSGQNRFEPYGTEAQPSSRQNDAQAPLGKAAKGVAWD